MTTATSAPNASGEIEDLQARYESVRALTERLAAPLSAEDQTVQSMADVSPTKWHRAHTSWFFETFLLRPGIEGYREFDPAFAYLFNSYYEAVGPRHARPERGLLTRPGIAEIARYRQHVDEAMAGLLSAAIPPDQYLVELGLHHEQQHQELLLMDIKHVLWCNPLHPAYHRAGLVADPSPSPAPSGWIEHAGGLVDIGYDGSGFSFDNESPRHAVWLEPFAMASALVTCGEWLEFMTDGGYVRPELWLSDGWATVQADDWHAPLYWWDDGGEWRQFTLAGPKAVDPAEPVCHVSYYEADAFARWAGYRLPTECEWEQVARLDSFGGPTPEAVIHPRAASRGSAQFFGEVWQWTASPYVPYPGFVPGAGAIGEYNGKFMVNQYVLRGGCCATPPGHARVTYRNFFGPACRWPFSGLRLAASR